MSMDVDQAIQAAMVHQNAGRLDEAIGAWRQLIESHPKLVRAYVELGICYRMQGRLQEALAAVQQAALLRPDDWQIAIYVAGCLRGLGRLEEAAVVCRRAVSLNPRGLEPYNRLAELLHAMGRLSDVEAVYRDALVHVGDHPAVYFNLGWSLFGQGRVAEACANLRRAVALAPDWAHANSRLLFALLHDASSTPEQLFGEHLKWARRHAEPLATRARAYANARDPQKRIRVGYVSSDFRQHSVMSFLEPILAHHDHGQIEIFCYSDVPAHEVDDVTHRARNYADHWRQIVHLSPEQAAELVASDAIDILVDLSGHTSARLLGLFARSPAPVQISYLGYPATTGMKAIEYRLTDAIADPPGDAEQWHTERLIRLEPAAWCYRPPADAPAVAPAPCASTGQVTFGSFNMLSKITPAMIDLWARIVHGVPRSRLIIKAQALSDEPTRQRIYASFDRLGIGQDRLQLLPRTESAIEHLVLYGQIDITLDTFPYNGTTTTCEALWMGVPVVSLFGRTHVSRVGLSLLSAIGLSEYTGGDADQYVRTGTSLAADPMRLMEVRNTMRQRMSRSPLMDEPGFARKIENAFREAWGKWCSQ